MLESDTYFDASGAFYALAGSINGQIKIPIANCYSSYMSDANVAIAKLIKIKSRLESIAKDYQDVELLKIEELNMAAWTLNSWSTGSRRKYTRERVEALAKACRVAGILSRRGEI